MFAPGTVVGGRYRLLRQVGEGGMATVWHAEHQTLGSPVAVKFLHSPASSVQSTDRFLREARVAAAVRHRNVIEIIDFGLTDDQVPFMVMELLVGQSLAGAFASKTPPDVVGVLRLMSLCLRGLAAVHDAGIVHRDIKPENIFLVEDADGTFPKLLDFGVSRASRDPETSETREGALIGTPDYMSPEQARGLRDIDRRTDIYSMGAILYEGVTGRLPFESENLGDLIVMITTQAPKPVTELRTDLGEALPAVIHQALAKNREDRFQDARQMRQAILDCLRELDPDVERPTVSSEWPERTTGSVNVRRLLPTPEDTGGHPLRPSRDAMADITPAGGIPPHLTPAGREPKPLSPAGGIPDHLVRAKPKRSLGHVVRQMPRRMAVMAFAAMAIVGVLVTPMLISALSSAPRDAQSAINDTPSMPEPLELLDYPTAGPYTEVLARHLARHEEVPRVRVVLAHVPEGAQFRADGVPITAPIATLPRERWTYRLTVATPDGRGWEVEHPGLVDGEYEVWIDSTEDASSSKAAAAESAERVRESSHRKRRLRRRPPRRTTRSAVRTKR